MWYLMCSLYSDVMIINHYIALLYTQWHTGQWVNSQHKRFRRHNVIEGNPAEEPNRLNKPHKLHVSELYATYINNSSVFISGYIIYL